MSVYSCSDDRVWKAEKVAALKTGQLESLREGVKLPEFKWRTCDGKDHCQALNLKSSQKLLAVGQHGNEISFAVAETCGDDTSVLIGAPDGTARLAIRGRDIAFESAALGGDRFLLGGFARHRTDQATEGFVPREYLITGREGKFAKLEAARNKLKAVPRAAASQIVHVEFDGQRCTTLFWKLGVSDCDFMGPVSDQYAILSNALIFERAGKGIKWSANSGETELLRSLEWIIGDTVNVAWSAEGHLHWAQPRWNFETLEGKQMPGAPGERPIGMGCGRLLTKTSDGWELRNVEQGTRWVLGPDRFPDGVGTRAVLTCEHAFFDTGHRVDFLSPGPQQPVSATVPAAGGERDAAAPEREVASDVVPR